MNYVILTKLKVMIGFAGSLNYVHIHIRSGLMVSMLSCSVIFPRMKTSTAESVFRHHILFTGRDDLKIALRAVGGIIVI